MIGYTRFLGLDLGSRRSRTSRMLFEFIAHTGQGCARSGAVVTTR